jgi:hypothetical protein
VGDLEFVGVAVGVGADYGVDDLGQHRHRRCSLLWGQVGRQRQGPPSGISVRRHASSGGQASDQANRRPGRRRRPGGQVEDKARRSGQILSESRRGHRRRAWWSSLPEHRSDTLTDLERRNSERRITRWPPYTSTPRPTRWPGRTPPCWTPLNGHLCPRQLGAESEGACPTSNTGSGRADDAGLPRSSHSEVPPDALRQAQPSPHPP